MNKNIVVTLIAGAFFAAGAVGPAFAGSGTTPEPTRLVDTPDFDIRNLPDLKIEEQLLNAEKLTERLRNLDLKTVLEKNGAPNVPTLPDLGTVDLPQVEPRPEIEPLEPPELPDVIVAPEGPEVLEVPERTIDDELEERTDLDPLDAAAAPGRQVKEIVAATKLEKAEILAAHGGDRKAAKAELKAAQMRMVDQIKADNGAARKGAAKGRKK